MLEDTLAYKLGRVELLNDFRLLLDFNLVNTMTCTADLLSSDLYPIGPPSSIAAAKT